MTPDLVEQINAEESLHFLELDSDIDEVELGSGVVLRVIQSSDWQDWFGFRHIRRSDRSESLESVPGETARFRGAPIMEPHWEMRITRNNYVIMGELAGCHKIVETFNKAIALWALGKSGVKRAISRSRCSHFYPEPGWINLSATRLLKSEIPKFLDFMRKIDDCENPRFQTLLERYRHAISGSGGLALHNRYVDLVTTMEMLFVEDSGRGEISYKFRMRAAKYLAGQLGMSPKDLVEEFSKIYGNRSAIAHSGKLADVFRDDWNFLINATRISLRNFLDRPDDFSAKSLNLRLLS